MKKKVFKSKPCTAGVIVGGVNGGIVKKAVKDGAEILEVRIDTFSDRGIDKLKKDFIKLKALTDLPILLTVRSAKEGGKYPIDSEKRAEIFENLIPFSDIIDIELSSSEIMKDVVNSAKRKGKKVIISYHNFKSTPGESDLQGIIRKARQKGGDIVKIAAFAADPLDLKRLAGFLINSNDLIIIAMGQSGAASRVFFPMLGSLVTYGSLTGSTAPGQLSLKDLRKEFKRYGFKG
ncbi:MAG: type I 3-dehydroquinate dehydratase [Deltaproteobacteria bacterium]|nr:type I 3-dehydroquinate dehydratase [Deltaproteobacteria bacterium]